MTTTNTMVAKIAAVVAGFGLVLTGFAPMAGAQTTNAELEAQIAALMAQIAALQAQTGGSASASMMFSRDLTIGATGADVTALQNWLIKGGYAIPAGATGYFGAQTQAALAKYQAANMISPAAGYFGPITRAKVNASAGGSTGGNDDDDDDMDDDELDGGESSLEDLQGNDGMDDDVTEGDTAEVAEFEFDVEDGDVRIDRLDLAFTSDATGSDEDEPWETFETITIYNADGDELASEDVSDEDDWLDEDSPYVFRFTNLDYVVREGEQGMLVVEVEAQNGIDGVESGSIAWTVFVDEDGIRGTDGQGIEQYLGETDRDTPTEEVTFDVEEEGEGEELNVRRSSEDPDASTLQVEDDETSDWYTVLAFELDAEDADVEINDLPIDFTVSSGEDVDDVINDVMLVIDGEEFDDFDFTNAGDEFGSTTFDIDGDYIVDEGETVTVEVMVEFKALDGTNYDAGDTIAASVVGANIDAEGSDDITPDGNVTGDTHTLQVTGIDAEVTADSATTEVVDGSDNDYAEFELTVDVTSFDEDIYISKSAGTAFTYQIEDSSGNVIGTSTATSSAISSTADEEGNFFVVDEDSTEEFTFSAVYNPLAADEGEFYRFQLLTIEFNDTAASPDSTYTASPANEFETDSTVVND